MDKVNLTGISRTPRSTNKVVEQGKHKFKVIEVDGIKLRYLLKEGISYDHIKTIEDVIAFEKEHNLLVATKPPLYDRFIDKEKNIRTFVKKGDSVKPRINYSNSSLRLIGEVEDIKFGKLDDMAIILAKVNGEYVVSYYLETIPNDN